MIRNLARRLVKVDLLTQAADLLEYQIDSRLNGVAQAQIAADLAVIRIADRNPEGALRVLNKTRLADLSPQLERQRRILEARALIDAGREELALDLISQAQGQRCRPAACRRLLEDRRTTPWRLNCSRSLYARRERYRKAGSAGPHERRQGRRRLRARRR